MAFYVGCVFVIAVGVLQLVSDTIAQTPGEKNYLNTEIRLFHHLIDNYTRSVRPVSNPNKTLPVQIALTMIGLEELDERTQALTLNGWLKLDWSDEQLSWNPADFDGLDKTRIPISKIWRPDITIFNHFSSDMFIHEEDMSPLIYSSGYILWIPKVRLTTRCTMNLYNFPYDQHVCDIVFGSWTHSEQEMNLTTAPGAEKELELLGGYYQEHLHWRMFDPTVKRNSKKYPCCPEKYVDVTYTLNLERRSAYHLHLIVAPSILLGLLVPVLFILPPEGREKSIFGFGLMISTILMLQQLGTYIPVAHPVVPRIGTFYISTIVLIGISLAVSGLVTNIWHRSGNKSAMPACIRGVVGLLSKLFCVNRDDYMPVSAEDNLQSPRRMEVMVNDGQETPSEPFADDNQRFARTFSRLTASSEWRQLAVVMDRLCFCLFVVITILIMIGLVR